jgi:hypothetical protein
MVISSSINLVDLHYTCKLSRTIRMQKSICQINKHRLQKWRENFTYHWYRFLQSDSWCTSLYILDFSSSARATRTQLRPAQQIAKGIFNFNKEREESTRPGKMNAGSWSIDRDKPSTMWWKQEKSEGPPARAVNNRINGLSILSCQSLPASQAG